jgi:hypothetical protein
MKQALVVVALLSGAAYGTYRWMGHGHARETATAELAQDRIWIDHMPKNDRDTIQVFAAITEQPVGIFQSVSQWKGAHELFLYEMNGGEMRLHYPQTNDREKVKAAARTCSENQFDYCLELSGNSRGVKKYYSRKGWEIESTTHDAKALEQRIEAIEAQLATETPSSSDDK